MTPGAGSVRSTPGNQPGRGGSIPASALHFRTAANDDAFDLIERHHYSHRIPANVQFIGTFHRAGGLFGDFGPCVAAAVFSIPPTRWSEPVIELTRLCRAPGVRVPLSLLVRLCLKWVRRDGADLVVSYADVAQGHHGGVYQACGWHYNGLRPPKRDGVFINGQYVPCRSANSYYGTNSPRLLTAKLGTEVTERIDGGKHLYWRALIPSGRAKAQRLGLGDEPYPKDDVTTPGGDDGGTPDPNRELLRDHGGPVSSGRGPDGGMAPEADAA